MATLASITSQAASAAGGPYVPVPATGPTSGPYVAYVLVPANLVSAGDPTGHLHIGGGHTIDELSALLTAGQVPVVQPSAQQDLGPTDQVWG